jgi:RecB family exonuclease
VSVIAPAQLAPRFDAAEEGTLGHDVLEQTYKELATACTAEHLPAFVATMERHLTTIAEKRRPAGAGRAYDVFVRRMRIGLRRLLRDEAARGPLFAPRYFERELSSGSQLTGGVVGGRTDRIDVSADGSHLFIVDYKRSGRKFDDKKQTQLQLPLYGLMASHELGPEPAGGAYLALIKPDDDGRVVIGARAYATGLKELDAEEWERRVESAKADAEGAMSDIGEGILRPVVCDRWYCSHSMLWR